MDTTVRASLTNRWAVTDLLERSVCSIVCDPRPPVLDRHDECGASANAGRAQGAVQGAMQAIEKNLRGACRHDIRVGAAHYFP